MLQTAFIALVREGLFFFFIFMVGGKWYQRYCQFVHTKMFLNQHVWLFNAKTIDLS